MGPPRHLSRCRAAAALALCALASCVSVTPRAETMARVDAVSEARLRAHVEALCAGGPRPMYDDPRSAWTLAYLERELRALGYEPVREVYQAHAPATRLVSLEDGGWRVEPAPDLGRVDRANLVAEIRGGEDPLAVVELSAHYDTVVSSPGADDNASGVAALLEAARVLADARPSRTIRFVFFAAEEYGMGGSRAHVDGIGAEERARFVGLLNLDGVGYADSSPGSQRSPVWLPIIGFPDRADFLAVLGTFSSGWLGARFEAAVDAYVPELRYWSGNRIGGFFDDARRSDHRHYWDAGLPAVFLTGTAEFRHDHYHRPTDLPGIVDYGFLRRVTGAVAAAALDLAERGR